MLALVVDVDGGKSFALAQPPQPHPPHIMTTVVCSLRHTRTRHSGAIFDPRVPFHRHFDVVGLGTLAAISVKVAFSSYAK